MSANNLNSILTIPINSTIQDGNNDLVMFDSKMTNKNSSSLNSNKIIQQDDYFQSDTSSLKSIKKYFQLEIESKGKNNNEMLLGSIENIDLIGLDSYDENLDDDENYDDEDELDVNNKDFTRVTKYSHLMKSKINRREFELNDPDDDTFISDQQNDDSLDEMETYKKYSYLDSDNKSINNVELKKIYKELNEIHNKLMVTKKTKLFIKFILIK